MHKAISLVLPSVTDDRANEGLGRELATHLVGDMDEGLAAKDAKSRHVGFVAAPGFFWGGIGEGTSGGDVMK